MMSHQLHLCAEIHSRSLVINGFARVFGSEVDYVVQMRAALGYFLPEDHLSCVVVVAT